MKLGLTYHQAFQYGQAQQAYREAFRLWQHGPTPREHPVPEAPHPLRLITVEPLTLDPALASDGFSARATRLLFAGLVEQTKTREIVPDIATHWEIENGGCSYVFHLRRDVRWSDGTFLTAHDFEFACKRVLAPTTEAPLASHLYDVKGARAYHQGVHTNGAQV